MLGPEAQFRRSLASSLGFTLPELLIVLAIVGVLASMAFAVGQRATYKIKAAVRQHGLRQLQAALEFYHGEQGIWPGSLHEIVARPSAPDRPSTSALLTEIPPCPDGRFDYDGRGHVQIVLTRTSRRSWSVPPPHGSASGQARPAWPAWGADAVAAFANALANTGACLPVLWAVCSTLIKWTLRRLSKPLWLRLLDGPIQSLDAAVGFMIGKVPFLWFAVGGQHMRRLTGLIIIHMCSQIPQRDMPLRRYELDHAAQLFPAFWRSVTADPQWKSVRCTLDELADRATIHTRRLLTAIAGTMALYAACVLSHSLLTYCLSLSLLLLSLACLLRLSRALSRRPLHGPAA